MNDEEFSAAAEIRDGLVLFAMGAVFGAGAFTLVQWALGGCAP